MALFSKNRRGQADRGLYHNPYISAIIAAAGKSSRMDGQNKLFMEIDGVPLIVRTVSAFQEADVIDEIIVVSRDGDIAEMQRLFKEYELTKVKIIARGAASRQDSVMNGVVYVSKICDYICIHDGARPLVTTELITRVAQDAVRYGAATAAVPVKDTIKMATSDGFVRETPDRRFMYTIQTPQIFFRENYKLAISEAGKNSIIFTDDSQLFEMLGLPVHITHGDYNNIKVTTPGDILLAELLCDNEEAFVERR